VKFARSRNESVPLLPGQFDPGNRQCEPENTARSRKYEALNEKLPKNPRSTGPECCTHGNLSSPRCSFGEEQVGKIRTGNEQQDAIASK
jgi:hypothetical protein